MVEWNSPTNPFHQPATLPRGDLATLRNSPPQRERLGPTRGNGRTFRQTAHRATTRALIGGSGGADIAYPYAAAPPTKCRPESVPRSRADFLRSVRAEGTPFCRQVLTRCFDSKLVAPLRFGPEGCRASRKPGADVGVDAAATAGVCRVGGTEEAVIDATTRPRESTLTLHPTQRQAEVRESRARHRKGRHPFTSAFLAVALHSYGRCHGQLPQLAHE